MRQTSRLITKSELEKMGFPYHVTRKAPANKQFKALFTFDRTGKISKVEF